MEEIRGNLISMAQAGELDVIVHGCNCYHTMGAGIAKQIRNAFPKAYEADLATPIGTAKLGTYSVASVSVPDSPHALQVINAYTQGRPGKDLKVWAMAAALMRVAQDYPDVTIGMPLIGCGIAGGNWNDLKKMVHLIFGMTGYNTLKVVHFV